MSSWRKQVSKNEQGEDKRRRETSRSRRRRRRDLKTGFVLGKSTLARQ
jgi:hypothetical protein